MHTPGSCTGELGNAQPASSWSRQAAGLRVPLLKDPSPAQQHTYSGELQYSASAGICYGAMKFASIDIGLAWP